MSDSNHYDFSKHETPSRIERSASAPSPFRRTTTRADILESVIASCPNVSRGEAREVFEMALEEVAATLKRGEAVKLRSFGHFNVREKRERIGRNPRTGVEVPIKPRRVLTFKASPVLLDQVNGQVADAREPVDQCKRGH